MDEQESDKQESKVRILELKIPIEEEVHDQQTITFHGDPLVLLYSMYQKFYVTLPSLCQAFGLHSHGQVQRIRKSATLAPGLKTFTIVTVGGPQQVYCLEIPLVPQWLDSLRSSKYSPVILQKVDLYRKTFVDMVKDEFYRIGTLRAPLTMEEIIARGRANYQPATTPDPLLQQKLAMLAKITMNTPEYFTVPDSQIDRSLREASFSREDQWDFEAETPTFPASNSLEIYLGTPSAPLDAAEAPERLAALGGSTALTARIVMGLWNLRRHDSRLSINGSAAIHIDEIFAWRGLKKHKRILNGRQRSDGYRSEQKDLILRDLELLASCCVRGQCTVMIKNHPKTFFINSSYLRYSTVTTVTNVGDEELVGFFLSPGDWISTYEQYDANYLVDVDRRIFLLHPQNEQHELRLALYLVELWRQQEHEDTPVVMETLLRASMIVPDKSNLSRFTTRIEHAFFVLWQRGILGSEARCLDEIDRNKARWGNDWLAARWLLNPPKDLKSRPQTLLVSHPINSRMVNSNRKKGG